MDVHVTNGPTPRFFIEGESRLRLPPLRHGAVVTTSGELTECLGDKNVNWAILERPALEMVARPHVSDGGYQTWCGAEASQLERFLSSSLLAVFGKADLEQVVFRAIATWNHVRAVTSRGLVEVNVILDPGCDSCGLPSRIPASKLARGSARSLQAIWAPGTSSDDPLDLGLFGIDAPPDAVAVTRLKDGGDVLFLKNSGEEEAGHSWQLVQARKSRVLFVFSSVNPVVERACGNGTARDWNSKVERYALATTAWHSSASGIVAQYNANNRIEETFRDMAAGSGATDEDVFWHERSSPHHAQRTLEAFLTRYYPQFSARIEWLGIDSRSGTLHLLFNRGALYEFRYHLDTGTPKWMFVMRHGESVFARHQGHHLLKDDTIRGALRWFVLHRNTFRERSYLSVSYSHKVQIGTKSHVQTVSEALDPGSDY